MDNHSGNFSVSLGKNENILFSVYTDRNRANYTLFDIDIMSKFKMILLNVQMKILHYLYLFEFSSNRLKRKICPSK